MGGFSIGGLISGLDSNTLIEQLVQLERQPIVRLNNRIGALRTEQDALRNVRTLLTTLRDRAQDFQLGSIFDQFAAPSSNEGVLTTSFNTGSPVLGSYSLNVIQLASATTANGSAPLGSAINPSVALDSSGFGTEVTAGDFTINGQTINVDPTTDSLNSILNAINNSGAGVIATYVPTSDTVTIENATPGDTSLINFGASGDDSNFLAAINVQGATQFTNASTATQVDSTRNLGAIDPVAVLNTVNFSGGAITAGSFNINGVAINVDPATQSLSDVIGAINSSDAQVTASYDSTTDTIRVLSDALGSRTISFSSGTSNFLDVTNLTTATQAAGTDAQYSLNGGATRTSNSNTIENAIGGVTLQLLSTGTSTVTVSNDDDAIVEDVQEFIDAFNAAVTEISGVTGAGGNLANDGSIRILESSLRQQIFGTVSGLSGPFDNLLDIGISTGSTFESGAVSLLEIDVEAFRAALTSDRAAVEEVFSNSGETGIGDVLETYLESITSTQGFLNQRARAGGSIDSQIESFENSIERVERRVSAYELRLRRQFTQMEQLVSSFQSSGAALGGLSGGFSGLG